MPSPVHSTSAPTTRWSRANFAEAIQGVQTPLSWTFWDFVMERCIRRAFGNIGALPRAEVPPPGEVDRKVAGVFFGLPAGNVDVFHRIGEAMPGTSGAAVVESLFGERGLDHVDRAARRRRPLVAGTMPVAAVCATRRLPRAAEEIRAWWQAAVIEAPPADADAARALLHSAAVRFVDVGTAHATVSMIGQALAEQVEAHATTAWGSPERAVDLMTGYGGMEETQLMTDIWSVAHSHLGLSEFLARHGFHGPDEGNLASRVWREDPAPVTRLITQYRDAAVADPRQREATQIARRLAAEAELINALPAVRRAPARALLRMTRTVIPQREQGKAAFLRATDAARCAARILGADLAACGRLDHAEDVLFLTYGELVAGVTDPMQDVVAARRADDARFRTLVVPQTWTGNPVATVTAEPTIAAAPGEVRGIGVVGGLVRGRARVVLDPSGVDLEPGDVLVCRTTDPSWTPLFLLADALVIDTGGPMSHGAIVAREMGVPCVINTVTGTRDIPDGALIEVDPSTGRVRIAQVTA